MNISETIESDENEPKSDEKNHSQTSPFQPNIYHKMQVWKKKEKKKKKKKRMENGKWKMEKISPQKFTYKPRAPPTIATTTIVNQISNNETLTPGTAATPV